MAKINTRELDPVRYERVQKGQHSLKEQYASEITLARVWPFCRNRVEILFRGQHSASTIKCSQCGENVLFPPVQFRFASANGIILRR